jgi:hypothetical protein
VSFVFTASLGLALLLAIVALVREVRLRRALERLLRSLLSRLWRLPTHEDRPMPDVDLADDPGAERLP